MEHELGWKHQVNPFKVNWIKKFAQRAGPKPLGRRVLDLGAGQGWYSLYLLEQGFEVNAIDQNPGFSHPKVQIRKQSLEEPLPYQDNEFDFILAWDIIEHVKNEDLLLGEMKRILKPGGRILVSVPHKDDTLIASCYLTYAHFKDKTHFREYIPQELRDKFSQIQLKTLHWELMGGGSYLYTLLCFIRNPFIRLITRIYIGLLKKLGLVDNQNCHGDIFAVFEK